MESPPPISHLIYADDPKPKWYERVAAWCERRGKVNVIPDRTGNKLYLTRYYLHPRWLTLGLFRVNLHRFHSSDDERDGLHCHPWPYITIVIAGGYIEHMEDGSQKMRKPGHVVFASAKRKHRVELTKTKSYYFEPQDKEAWTLFIMGPRRRTWGFYVGGKFYHYKEWLKIRGYYNGSLPKPKEGDG